MMKTLKKVTIISLLCCGMLACKDTKLEDFVLENSQGVQVSASEASGNIVKTNESLTIPIDIKLSNAATKAFEVALSVNQDTIQTLIQNGQLKEVSALTSSAIQIDNVAKVAFGSNTSQFKISIARTEVEKHFGKKVAIGYSLTNAGKGNNINATQSTGIIVLNTVDFLTEDDIHYISLQAGGTIIQAKDRQNYTSSSGGITVPLTLNLASFPGSAFSMDIATDTDTIQDMITKGDLPANTVALQSDQFSVPGKASFQSNSSESRFELTVPWSAINDNLGKYLAITVRLDNPSLHLLNPEKNSATILIDCDNVLEEDVTHLGVLSVNRDNSNTNENAVKLVDNNINTKFLQGNFTGDLVLDLVFPEAQKIGAYSFTSANDADTRDPKEWNLQASNDGVTWTTIDSRTNESFGSRLLTRRFNILYPTAYTHYRLNITAIKGGTNLFQMAEWRMIKVR